MPAIDLIIFDCDGVLVDSEPLAMRVLVAAIKAQGIEVVPEDAFRDYLGRSLSSISESLHDSHGAPLGEAALISMRRDLYALYRKELKASPGMADALQQLRVPFCVASSSHLERIRLSLELTDLLPYFEPHIFSASMVENGKPAPDLFLFAAKAMGVAAERCLVIEDSPAGIAAAKAAGMRVFAYVGGSHIAQGGLQPGIATLAPDVMFDDMHRLPDLVASAQEEQAGEVMDALLVGVDVGTGSARAGVVTATGELLGRAEYPIAMRRLDANRAEHDSEDIWAAVCAAVRGAIAEAKADPAAVVSLAFDATCSLVLRDSAGAPVGVSGDDGERWDTFVWLDHRAMAEAVECTATRHRVLDFAGGVMSPEMQIPKLMWLKRQRHDAWARLGHAFDLADFLSWKATGSLARSQSSLVCKWNFLGHEANGWAADFHAEVGLSDLLERTALPNAPSAPGAVLGTLSDGAAAELGLTTACRVGAGLIDAHAGALGALAEFAGESATLDQHLALVAGTSNSVIALATEARPIHGVWGPYFGALLPDAWLSEGGQSAAGALLDHLIRTHQAGGEPTMARHVEIVARIGELRLAEGQRLASRLHVLPDFHGNRSPLAEPAALGVISGLTLDTDFDSLCRLYWRASVAIALGLRQIIESFGAHGYGTRTLHISGGHRKNPLLMELYADATGCAVFESEAEDVVLLGTAMVAATAAGLYPSIAAAAVAMQRPAIARRPDASRWAGYDRDYRVFLAMQWQRAELERIGAASEPRQPAPHLVEEAAK